MDSSPQGSRADPPIEDLAPERRSVIRSFSLEAAGRARRSGRPSSERAAVALMLMDVFLGLPGMSIDSALDQLDREVRGYYRSRVSLGMDEESMRASLVPAAMIIVQFVWFRLEWRLATSTKPPSSD